MMLRGSHPLYIGINNSIANVNIADRLDALEVNIASLRTVVLIISPGVTVYSEDPLIPALATGDLAGLRVRIINHGNILGKGGDAGVGAGAIGLGSPNIGEPGHDGGIAVQIACPVEIYNSGIIGGGGGGGGGGGRYSSNALTDSGGGGGGGGAGLSIGVGGEGGRHDSRPGSPGTSGSDLVAGIGGAGWGGRINKGGDGGALGSAGVAGVSVYTAGGAGGAAGKAVEGNSFITWLATGTRLGSIT